MKADVCYAIRHTPGAKEPRVYERWDLIRLTTNEQGRKYPAILVAHFDSSAEAVFFREWLEQVAQ